LIDSILGSVKGLSSIAPRKHAVGRGANATAASYVETQDADGRVLHGVGMDPNIVMASLKASLGAVLRLMRGGGRAL
jgi:2-isopropylmalate synthase